MSKMWKGLLAIVTALQVAALLYPSVANAQGTIASGQTLTGTIAPIGHSDSWTFSANTGDAIVIRVGEITQAGSFAPRIRLFSPTSALLATASNSVGAEIAVTAASTGTFTVIVDDAVGTTATGTYRLTLAKTGSPVVVSPGDEGGALTNGAMHTGTIDVGDLDVWTVDANLGETIMVRLPEHFDIVELQRKLRERFGPKAPAVICRIKSIPRNAMGKVIRAELSAKLGERLRTSRSTGPSGL